ncbi:MAG: thermonuclease family protein [Pseudomonadota bacterium]
MIEYIVPTLLSALAGGPLGELAGDERLSFAGPAPAAIERVVDGDTVKARVAIWIDQEIVVSVRLLGIDAPELFRPKCAAEKARAKDAKHFVENFLRGQTVTLTDIERGKYAGRVAARINVSGRDLSDALVSAGFAVEGVRGAWCGP